MPLALLSAALFGFVAIIDKRLIDKYLPSLSTYYTWIGFAVFFYGLLFLAVSGVPEDANKFRLLAAGVSGLCWGGAMALTFWGFKLQEVSRASAVLFTSPIFVALLAAIFLGESLLGEQWIAIIVVMFGAFLISLSAPYRSLFLKTNNLWNISASTNKHRVRLTRAFPILIGASLLTALGHVTGKYALDELSIWLVTSLRFFGMAAVLAFFWHRQAIAELRQVLRHKEALVLFGLAEGILIPLAVVLMIMATKLGPVSLVATLTGIRPAFILLYSILLSLPGIRFLNESLDRRTLMVKLLSVIMIISGIASLSLLGSDSVNVFAHIK